MYLGQEIWAGAAAQTQHGTPGRQPTTVLPPSKPGGVQTQHGTPGRQPATVLPPSKPGGGIAHQAQLTSARPVGPEVGDANSFIVTGCRDPVVGPTIRGNYQLCGLNHGKPFYKRQGQVNGFDVVVFYWDQRDGPTNSGWWFAPSIGSEEVWAYQPSQAATLPTSGWRVPISGAVDPSVAIRPSGMHQMGQHPVRQHQQQQHQHQQQLNPQQQQQLQQQKQQQQQKQKQIVEDQKKRMEEQRKQFEEANKGRMEEKRAVATIEAAMKKMTSVQQSQFEDVRKEFEAVLARELDKCGNSKEKMKSRSEQCLKQVEDRIKLAAERQAKLEEARKEVQERTERILGELRDLVGSTEECAQSLSDAVAPFEAEDLSRFTKEEDIDSTKRSVDEAYAKARQKLKDCSEFIANNSSTLSSRVVPPPRNGASASDDKGSAAAALPELSRRIAESTRNVEKAMFTHKGAEDKLRRKVKATLKLENRLATFKKYDKDGDSALNRKEVSAYVKGEFGTHLTPDQLEFVFSSVAPDQKTIPVADGQRLKVMVGVVREKTRNERLRSERKAQEENLLKLKAEFEAQVEKVSGTLEEVEKEINDVDSAVKEFVPKSKAMKSADMISQANDIDKRVSDAKGKADTASERVKDLQPSTEQKAAEAWKEPKAKKLTSKLNVLEVKLAKVNTALEKVRVEANAKSNIELEDFREAALRMMRHHCKSKSLKFAELFKLFDTDKDGQISKAEFIKVLPTLEAEPDTETPWSSQDLPRLFTHLDENRQGFITLEVFEQMLIVYMKVVKEAAITNELSIKESSTVRRLDMNEVVQVLEGPVKDPGTDLLRVRVTTVKEETKGWVTVKGSNGTLFLAEGGGLYKVAQETILTPEFDIGAATRALKDTTRKLKVGEVLEVREWPKEDKATGLSRMKCRVKRAGGEVGWATTVSSQGTVFLVAM